MVEVEEVIVTRHRHHAREVSAAIVKRCPLPDRSWRPSSPLLTSPNQFNRWSWTRCHLLQVQLFRSDCLMRRPHSRSLRALVSVAASATEAAQESDLGPDPAGDPALAVDLEAERIAWAVVWSLQPC